MKCSDLQIGDYVRFKRTKEKVWVFEIDGDRNIINNEPDGYCSEKNIDIDDVEPIPLTPEILKLNGFVIKKKWAQKGNFGDNPLIMWHYDDDINTRDFKHELEIHQNDTGKVHVSLPCDYVHELQHAFRLCGLNDLADNLKL